MKRRLFLVSLFVFAGIAVIVVVATAQFFPTARRVQIAISWQYVFLAVVVVMGALSFLRKFRHRMLWEILFTLTLFLGVWYAFLLVLPVGWALAIASACTLAEIFFRNVFVHNLFYAIGAAGVAINFAGWLPSDVLLVGLVAFTVYDMVAGPPGGPIQSFAADLIQKGIIPGAVIPLHARDLTANVDDVVRRDATFLGAGDLILPLCLVARASFRGVGPAVLVLSGLVIGAFLLGRSNDLHPRAALPALAVGAAIPFLVLRIFSLV